ncbi:MAG: DUF6129 family protein [Azoarcus sp.]|jgi:hypothetical protein|nr:DUF6129 family protein [Azoarcus sp.]
MGISQELLRAVADSVAATTGGGRAAGLRAQFPGVMLTECSEDDVPARVKPVLETPAHAYFLVTGANGHCLAFTGDFDAAMGIVVAERADED